MRHVQLHVVVNSRISRKTASRPSTASRRDPGVEGSLVYRRRLSPGNEQAQSRNECTGKMAFETPFESGLDYSPFARRNPWARP